MTTNEGRFETTFGCLIISAMVCAMVAVLYGIVRGLGVASESISVAIISAAAMVAVPLATLIYVRRWDRKAQIAEQQRATKIELYEQVLSFYFDALFAEKRSMKHEEKRTLNSMHKWTQKLLLWSSDRVLVRYSEFRQALISEEVDEDLIFKFETMIRVMRADLGHRNEDVTSETVLGTFATSLKRSQTE